MQWLQPYENKLSHLPYFFKEKGKDMAAARQSVVVSSIECVHDVY
jgi:hypothetical protein